VSFVFCVVTYDDVGTRTSVRRNKRSKACLGLEAEGSGKPFFKNALVVLQETSHVPTANVPSAQGPKAQVPNRGDPLISKHQAQIFTLNNKQPKELYRDALGVTVNNKEWIS
jgi:hypothetical protein